MADGTITMNPGTGGNVLDTTLIGGTKHRERIQIGGTAATDLAPVDATYGLAVDVTRVAGTVATTVSNMIPAVETGLAKDATLTGVAKDGTDGTGITAPTGGTGIRGWLSGIYERLTNRLPAALVGGRLDVNIGAAGATVPVSGTFFQATQPVSGTVTANAGTGTMSTDVTDRTARLLGHVTVDSAPTTAVTGTFWPATQPVSGTVTVSNPTANPETGLAKDATLTGGTQKTKIVDTAGTNVATVSAAGAVKVDGSAVTQPVSGTFWQATQPVSGTVTATGPLTDAQLRATPVPVSGSFFQATQPVSLATNTPDVTDRAARLLGHVTVDNASIPVTGTFWQATQPVSGTVTAKADQTAGTAAAWTSATALNTAVSLTVVNYGAVTITVASTTTLTAGAVTFEASDDSGTTWYPVAATRVNAFLTDSVYTLLASTNQMWTMSADAMTNVRVRLSTAITGTAAVGVRLTAFAFPIEPMVTVGGTVKPQTSTTGTQTSVASSLTSVTLLAANTNRMGATVYNDSTANLFLKLGATASATSFAVKMAAGSYYEVPFSYTGIIDGLWDVANGNARVTEMT